MKTITNNEIIYIYVYVFMTEYEEYRIPYICI